MNAADYLSRYVEGWTSGDAGLILQAVTDDYEFDDPNTGKVPKAKFNEYLSNLKASVKKQCDGGLPEPFVQLSEVVTSEHDGHIKAWCWREVPSTNIKGSGLIKVSPTGVYSEVITYYIKIGS